MTLADRLRAGMAVRDPAPALLFGDDAFDATGTGPGDDPAREEAAGAMSGPTPTVAAAVLVAITDRAAPGVLLTRRNDRMRAHAGQVAFPGGRVDPQDDGPVAAALREAEEEIGLPRTVPDVVGVTDRYRTVTGYDVTPVVAVVPPDLPLVPQEAEVAKLFEVPLAFLLDPRNHRVATTVWRGRNRTFYEMHWDDNYIWGATAAMIVNLSRRLAP